jgi:hypothetical protein
MSETVVDRLEMIDVDDEQCSLRRRPLTRYLLEVAVDERSESSPVQAGRKAVGCGNDEQS